VSPVVSHCSLDAAYAERPRPTAPIATRTLLVTSRGSRLDPRGAFAPRPSEQHGRA